MRYLLFILCFAAIIAKGQPDGPNSAYFSSLPFCTEVDTTSTLPYDYCMVAIKYGGNIPILNVVNNNPLNTTLNVCTNELVTFHYQGAMCGSDNVMDMGDDCGFLGYWAMWPYMTTYTLNTNFYVDYAYNAPGTYVVNVVGAADNCIMARTTINVVNCDNATSAANCQGSFRPAAGDYVVSFWVKDDVPIGTAITYSSGIEVVLTGMATGPSTIQVFANDVSNAQNTIIDGWQKVEKVITIPPDATGIEVALKSRMASADTYFDDIRIHPFNSSFKSYVYDPVTLRLAAELDERNYATFYEYDEEGQLVRVKKETERGIKTIKESRTSVSK